MNSVVKEIMGVILVMLVGFGILSLILQAPSVKNQEYKSCMVTFTDKTVCETIKN